MSPSQLSEHSRRKFINKAARSVVAASIFPNIIQAAGEIAQDQLHWLKRPDHYGPNDQVQVALIGAGGMGNADADTCITVPGSGGTRR